jgi:N-acetylmuramoyl-L-alanine amidase
MQWDDIARVATVEGRGNRIAMRPSSQTILLNGNERKLDRPVVMNSGVVMVPVSFARNNLGYLIDTHPPERVPQSAPVGGHVIRTVIIDAGHGGKDAGAVGRRLRMKEKEINLYVARRIQDALTAKGVKVIMTRDSNTFIALSKRSDTANRGAVDLFISVHTNSARTKTMNGFECYYLSEKIDDNARAADALEKSSLRFDDTTLLDRSRNTVKTLADMMLTEDRAESAELALSICDSVEHLGNIKNRGIKSARFYVLRNSHMPAVLVELGYLSNKAEEAKLKDNNFLNALTDAVAQGILKYKNRFESTEGFTRT